MMNMMFKALAFEQQKIQQSNMEDPGIHWAEEYNSEVKSCMLFG